MNSPILINGRFLSQRLTGVHRFAYEITCALQRAEVPLVVIVPSDVLSTYDCPFPVEKIHGKGSHWWEQVTLPCYIHRHYRGCPLISLTGLSPLLHSNSILTVHDVSFWVEPHWFTRSYYWWYRLMTPLAAKRAKHILTVSEFSKQEIMRYLHTAEYKITVVYNAVSNHFAQPAKAERYVLSVCSMDPRKNLKSLLAAYAQILEPDFKLYLIGGRNRVFTDNELQQYTNNSNIVFLDYVPDEQMNQYYANAIAFVSPSLYEGFGVPNLEAMNNHCPIAVSDIPPYHEVCGDAALYFNPKDINSIRDALMTITHSTTIRKELLQQAPKQLSRFDWDQSAQTILNIL